MTKRDPSLCLVPLPTPHASNHSPWEGRGSLGPHSVELSCSHLPLSPCHQGSPDCLMRGLWRFLSGCDLIVCLLKSVCSDNESVYSLIQNYDDSPLTLSHARNMVSNLIGYQKWMYYHLSINLFHLISVIDHNHLNIYE